MITEIEKRLLDQANAAMDLGAVTVTVDVGDVLDLLDQLTIARKSLTLMAQSAVKAAQPDS